MVMEGVGHVANNFCDIPAFIHDQLRDEKM